MTLFAASACVADQSNLLTPDVGKEASATPDDCEINDNSFSFPRAWLRRRLQGNMPSIPGLSIRNGIVTWTESGRRLATFATPTGALEGCLYHDRPLGANGALSFTRRSSNFSVFVVGTVSNRIVGPRNSCGGYLEPVEVNQLLGSPAALSACMRSYLQQNYPDTQLLSIPD